MGTVTIPTRAGNRMSSSSKGSCVLSTLLRRNAMQVSPSSNYLCSGRCLLALVTYFTHLHHCHTGEIELGAAGHGAGAEQPRDNKSHVQSSMHTIHYSTDCFFVLCCSFISRQCRGGGGCMRHATRVRAMPFRQQMPLQQPC